MHEPTFFVRVLRIRNPKKSVLIELLHQLLITAVDGDGHESVRVLSCEIHAAVSVVVKIFITRGFHCHYKILPHIILERLLGCFDQEDCGVSESCRPGRPLPASDRFCKRRQSSASSSVDVSKPWYAGRMWLSKKFPLTI